MALPKVRTKNGVYFVLGLEKAVNITGDMPGTVVASGEDGAVVSTMDGSVRIQALVDCAGTVAEPAIALPLGEKVNPLTGEELIALRRLYRSNGQARSLVREAPAGRARTNNIRFITSIPNGAAELSIGSLAGAVRTGGAIRHRRDYGILHSPG